MAPGRANLTNLDLGQRKRLSFSLATPDRGLISWPMESCFHAKSSPGNEHPPIPVLKTDKVGGPLQLRYWGHSRGSFSLQGPAPTFEVLIFCSSVAALCGALWAKKNVFLYTRSLKAQRSKQNKSKALATTRRATRNLRSFYFHPCFLSYEALGSQMLSYSFPTQYITPWTQLLNT